MRIFLTLILLSQGICGSEYYVSTSGNPSNDGSLSNPWSIQFALTNHSVVSAGDKIWIRGGTYSSYGPTNVFPPSSFVCTLVGATNNNIMVRAKPGESVIVDGGVYCTTADFVTFWGFAITCSHARTNVYSQRPAGLALANNCKAVNMVIYNAGHPGIVGTASEIYGCIVYGVGIFQYPENGDIDSGYSITNPWTRGSGMYLQHTPTNSFLVSDNISSKNFTGGIKCYAENGYVNGFDCDGNVVFLNNGEGIYCECLFHSITNYTARNNFTYRSGNSTAGYFSQHDFSEHYGLLYTNNYIIGSPFTGTALWLERWQTANVVSNIVITTSTTNEWSAGSGVGQGYGGRFLQYYPSTNVTSVTINSNSYHGGVEQDGGWDNVGGPFFHQYQPFIFGTTSIPEDGTNGSISFNVWTNLHGFDRSSSYTTNLPTSNVVTLRTNKYEPGRAHLVVINWQSNNTVNVDLTGSGLTNGQRFAVKDAQNYFGSPVLVTNYSVSTPVITVPLTYTNISPVTGDLGGLYTFDPNVHTASLFNVFVLDPSFLGQGTTASGNIKSTGNIIMQ